MAALRRLALAVAFYSFLLAVFLLALSMCGAQQPNFDFLITGARVVDGTGAPWFIGDIGIVGDHIAGIGDLHGATAKQRIDANGLVVSPGFIDLLGQSEFNLLVDNRAASKITQGVTTEITGEGTSIAPLNDRVREDPDLLSQSTKYGVPLHWRSLEEYLRRLESARPAINLGTLVGAGGLRQYVIGRDNRAATPAELNQMSQLVREAMQQGAFGLSSALQYVPDVYASTDELVELARVAREYGGVYFTHQRSEGDRIFQSLDEVFAIAERAQIPVNIWHLKTMFPENWNKMQEVLNRIEAARGRGLDVAANVHPYTRGGNGLVACFPGWISEGGTEKMLSRLNDPAERQRAKQEMVAPSSTWDNQWLGSGGAQGVLLVQVFHTDLKKYEGMTLAEIAQKLSKDPRDVAMDIAVTDRGETQVLVSTMDEADVRLAVSHPLISYGSDAPALAKDGPFADTLDHPRAFGTFPRVLGEYVREEHTMRLEEAVRKMTSLPASRAGIMDRGILRPGMLADVTVFDPATIKDLATYKDPLCYSVGVKHVFVNGRPVLLNGKITDERPGRALRGPGYKRAE